MKKTALIVIAAVVGLIVIFASMLIGGYNNLVVAEEDIAGKQSQVENRLQERYDTIGQMVATVNGLEAHAETIYNMITEAREAFAAAKAAADVEGMIEADNLQSIAMSDFFAYIEDNPAEITAQSAYDDLMIEIASIEGGLFVARKDFNDAVQSYNTTVRRFPTILYASMFGFPTSYDYWKIADGATEVPVIEF